MRSTWFKQSEAPKLRIPYVFNGYHTSKYLDEIFMRGAKIYCYEMSEYNPLDKDDPKVSFYVAHKKLYEDVYGLKMFTKYCMSEKGYGCVFYTNNSQVHEYVMNIYEKDLLLLDKGKLARKLMR